MAVKVRADQDGITIPPRTAGAFDVLFGGEPVWSFTVDGGHRVRGQRVRWPRALRRWLDGSADITLREVGGADGAEEDDGGTGDGEADLDAVARHRTRDAHVDLVRRASGKARRAFNASKKVGPLASWSPDGSKIVFTYFDELWIMNASGIGRGLLNLGGRMKMNVEDAGLIAWSLDGSRLAYAPQSDPSKVYLIDLTSKI